MKKSKKEARFILKSTFIKELPKQAFTRDELTELFDGKLYKISRSGTREYEEEDNWQCIPWYEWDNEFIREYEWLNPFFKLTEVPKNYREK